MTAFPAVARRAPLGALLGRALTAPHHGLLRSAVSGQGNAILVAHDLDAHDEGASPISEPGRERRVCHAVRLAGRPARREPPRDERRSARRAPRARPRRRLARHAGRRRAARRRRRLQRGGRGPSRVLAAGPGDRPGHRPRRPVDSAPSLAAGAPARRRAHALRPRSRRVGGRMTFEQARARFPVCEESPISTRARSGRSRAATGAAVAAAQAAALASGRSGDCERMGELRERVRGDIAALLAVTAEQVALTASTIRRLLGRAERAAALPGGRGGDDGRRALRAARPARRAARASASPACAAAPLPRRPTRSSPR